MSDDLRKDLALQQETTNRQESELISMKREHERMLDEIASLKMEQYHLENLDAKTRELQVGPFSCRQSVLLILFSCRPN